MPTYLYWRLLRVFHRIASTAQRASPSVSQNFYEKGRKLCAVEAYPLFAMNVTVLRNDAMLKRITESVRISHVNALTVVGALMTLTDFTLSNVRRFCSSMGNKDNFLKFWLRWIYATIHRNVDHVIKRLAQNIRSQKRISLECNL